MRKKLSIILAVVLLTQIIVVPAGKIAATADVAVDVSTDVAAGVSAQGLNVTSRSADSIKKYLKNGATVSDVVKFSKSPVLTAPYEMGKIDTASHKNALKMLNQIRYIAGLPSDITAESRTDDYAQGAAFVNAVNRGLSHFPTQPSGMSNSMFRICQEGARTTNLSYGYPTINSAMLEGWMVDDDAYNIQHVGHRRWILSPRMGKTSFGFVANGNYGAMRCFDASKTSSIDKIAWPAQNMPTEYFTSNSPWSFSTSDALDISKVKVTLTRKSDSKKWTFSKNSSSGDFYVSNDGYGYLNCIIFRPKGGLTYTKKDKFTVSITGIANPVSYNVNFFSLSDPVKKTVNVKSVSIKRGSKIVSKKTIKVSLKKDKKINLKAVINPSNATNKKVSWKSSKTKLAKVSSSGKVTLRKRGTVKITVTSKQGKKKATVKIKIKK